MQNRFEPIPNYKEEKKILEKEVLEWLKPYSEKLDIPVKEVVLNLHEQGIYLFENIEDLLNIEFEGEE